MSSGHIHICDRSWGEHAQAGNNCMPGGALQLEYFLFSTGPGTSHGQSARRCIHDSSMHCSFLRNMAHTLTQQLGHRGHQVRVAWLACCITAALGCQLVALTLPPAAAAATTSASSTMATCSSNTTTALAGGGGAVKLKMEATVEAIPGGSRAIWQVPPRPRAVLLVFHGRTHAPEAFWEGSPSCPACARLGLPEERHITRTALARGYAVLTVAALAGGADGAGWDDRPDMAVNADFRQLAAFLPAWSARHGLRGLPTAAFGVSQGGDFAAMLPLGMRVDGLVVMVAAGNYAPVAAAALDMAGAAPYPPTMFIHMPKDEATSESAQRNARALASTGVPTATLACHPFPLHDTLFSGRIPGLDAPLSRALVRALRDQGYLTPRGYLNQPDPVNGDIYRAWNWTRLVETLGVLPAEPAPYPWVQQVAAELSLSFAFHCCSGMKAHQMMRWFDAAAVHSYGARWDDRPTLRNDIALDNHCKQAMVVYIVIQV